MHKNDLVRFMLHEIRAIFEKKLKISVTSILNKEWRRWHFL